jgi:hypothetical protein
MRLECWHTAKSGPSVARFTKIFAICRSRFQTGCWGITDILVVQPLAALEGAKTTGMRACIEMYAFM